MNSGFSLVEIRNKLINFWHDRGCIMLDSYDLPVGAATFHPHTLHSMIHSELSKIVFVQRCRRPQDARGTSSKDRLMQHTQIQVMITPVPENIQALVCQSLNECGINCETNNISFVENNWQSATLGASGKGYEILCNGTEILQFTYFQKFGGRKLTKIPVELAYGLERLSMCSQQCDDFFELIFDYSESRIIKYHDVYATSEDHALFAKYDKDHLISIFKIYQQMFEAQDAKAIIPAYEALIMMNYILNLLDAAGHLSFYDRDNYIDNLRSYSAQISERYMKSY